MIRFDKRHLLRWFGIALSVIIVVVAGAALFRVLRDVKFVEVIDAARAMNATNIILAAFAITGSYLTLTFYDFFALRTIGRTDIPYRIAALTSFTSYTIGHSAGVMAVISAAVRYHIYSTCGLSAVEVGKVCFITGLTFWLGNACMLGLGLAFDPGMASLVDQLPAAVNSALAYVLFAAAFFYVLWVWQGDRVIGRGSWEVTLPNGPSTLIQILIGIVDLTCATAAMYLLMPDGPSIQFTVLLVVFISATLLGYASHAPGGLGVFDAAMLVALSQFEKEDLIARLLIFRMLCYVMPFALAVTILGIRQFWLTGRTLQPKS
jgi:uncharacterized membrane protein YbhN (UPF0104 family)